MSLFEDRLKIAREFQQQKYATSSDWNVFSRSEPGFLKNYVGFAMYGDPENIEADQYIFKDNQKKDIEKVFNQIMNHSDQTELIYCIAMYCLTFETENELKIRQLKEDAEKDEIKDDKVASEKNEDPKNEKDASEKNEDPKNEKDASEKNEVPKIGYRTIFKIRREKVERGKLPEFYNWFVDWDSRVYETWENFLANNNLPPCTMVVPKGGEYQPDPDQEFTEIMTHVFIEYRQSPACKSKYLSAIDLGSNVLQVASMGVGIAAAFTPVAPVALVVGAGVGIATSGYSAGRSIYNLLDRGRHKESLTDRRAIGEYVSIGGNILGAASLGASKYITTAALKGEEVGRAALIAHDCVTVGSVACKGTEIGQRIYGMFSGDEEITVTSCVGLIADIFFFSNIVVDMKMAKALIRRNQTGFIENHKKSLTKKRHRKSFNKMVKNADNTNEIIQKINKIRTPEELSKLAPINTFSASQTTRVNGSSISNVDRISTEIRTEWPAYSSEIVSIIMTFVPRVMAMYQNSDLKTNGDLYSLIFEFLWSTCKPVIRRMIRGQHFVETLSQHFETRLESMVSEFVNFLKEKYDTPILGAQRYTNPSNENNTKNPKNHGLMIRDFAVRNDLSVTNESVREIKKLFEEVDSNLPDESENFISALMQMSLFVLNSANIVDLKSHHRTFSLAISFLWDKFQEIMFNNYISTADECVLKLFDNSEENLTQMVQDFEVHLLANL